MIRPKGSDVGEAEALVMEAQTYGDTVIHLQETASTIPLTDLQLEILRSQGDRLKFLGLSLQASPNGFLLLTASNTVGSVRFVHQKKAVTVHVQPKIGQINFLRMLDYVYGVEKTSSQSTDVAFAQTEASGIFLEFFARTVSKFLHHMTYRNYSYIETAYPNLVKGRPMIKEYFGKFVPQASSHILPCRYINYSADVVENQIVLLTVHRAINLVSFLPPSEKRNNLMKELQNSIRMMAGVSIKRRTAEDIQHIHYFRINRHFQNIHRLCKVILDGSSVTSQAGEKLPFIAFAVNMPILFQSYIARIFKEAFDNHFIDGKSKLTYPLESYEKQIVLDGLLEYRHHKIVIECKYKDISNERGDFVIEGGKIRGADLYQVVAYTSHEQIQADASILVYPVWTPGQASITLANPIRNFGWHKETNTDIPIYILGINLSAPFSSIVRNLKKQILSILPVRGF
jgi:5-methylcytosine-specific restriction endonuclease McrBC regulatory subunit McrC